MDKNTETTINQLKQSVLAKCSERVERSKKKDKHEDRDPVYGVTAILKNKYLLVLAFACALMLIYAPVAAAGAPTIAPTKIIDLIGGGHTPPVAYIGEYVDLSKVVGWSGQIAFWYSGYPSGIQKPDIIIDASSFQHRFWIDPAKFKAGMWYKWDGAYEDSSNPEAFEVKAGIRPAPSPTDPASNFTGTTPIVTAVPFQKETVHLLLARGDQIEYPYWNPNEKYGYMWLFGKSQQILGEKMDSPPTDNNTFIFPFSEEITQNLEVGWYSGYMQFSNKRPDVFYNKSKNVLDTPYDDGMIPDVSIAGLTPDRVKAEFEKLEKNPAYSEDKLINITMEIKDPILQFTDYYEVGDSIIVQGKSTLSAGTNISFIIDPTRYMAGYSTSSHTVWTLLKGEMDEPRAFTVIIPVDWSQMAIKRHEVVGTIDKLKIKLVQKKEFDVTSVWIDPAPTKSTQKVIVEEGGWHRINSTVAGVTPTPSVVYVTSTPQIIYVYVTPTPTPNTTPPPTTVATKVPTPIPTTESPPSPLIAAGALVIVAYVVIRRR